MYSQVVYLSKTYTTHEIIRKEVNYVQHFSHLESINALRLMSTQRVKMLGVVLHKWDDVLLNGTIMQSILMSNTHACGCIGPATEIHVLWKLD